MDVRSNSELSKMYISSEVRFYTINDLIGLLGWSEATVQKLFNDPKFPAANFGRNKVVQGGATNIRKSTGDRRCKNDK